MSNISSIYWPGVVAAPQGGPYDPSKPQKLWVLPQSAWPQGAGPGDTFIAVAVSTQTAQQTAISMTYAMAASCNVYNPGSLGTPPAEIDSAQIPWPVDLALLKPGETIKADPMAIFGVLPDIIEPAPLGSPSVPATVDLSAVMSLLTQQQAMQVRLLNGVNLILAAMGQPKV